MAKWETKIVHYPAMLQGYTSAKEKNEVKKGNKEREEFFNELNRQGWKLVSVDNGIAYFERPIIITVECEIIGIDGISRIETREVEYK